MLKSLIISIRRKPKVVRDQAALVIAGGFTFIIFAIWIFSVPGRFTNVENTQSAEIFSSIREEIVTETSALSEATNELQEIIDAETASASIATPQQPAALAASASTTITTNAAENRPIRLATTTTYSTTSSAEVSE